MVKCKVCGKVFKTQQGLTDHMRSKHGTGAKLPEPQRRGRASSDSITLSGMERIYDIDGKADDAAFKKGTELFGSAFTSGSVDRLRTVSAGFQHWTISRLRYEIVSHTSRNVSGGYVAGFIDHPGDDVPTAAMLASTAGATSRSWSESGSVNVRVPRKRLDVEPSFDEDANDYSPGYFLLISDGTPDQRVNLVVNVHWEVVLSTAGFVRPPRKLVRVRLKGDLMPAKGTAHSSTKVEELLDEVPDDDFFLKSIIPLSVEYYEGAGDTGTAVHFYLYGRPGDFLYWSRKKAQRTPGRKWQSDVEPELLLPEGCELEVLH